MLVPPNMRGRTALKGRDSTGSPADGRACGSTGLGSAPSPVHDAVRSQLAERVAMRQSPRMRVLETFFGLGVRDMQRAIAFYVAALGASVAFTSPTWSSLVIAGVRVGLFLDAEHSPARVGVHFAVDDLAAARASARRAGGCSDGDAREVAPGVIIAEATDSEGNTFTLRQS